MSPCLQGVFNQKSNQWALCLSGHAGICWESTATTVQLYWHWDAVLSFCWSRSVSRWWNIWTLVVWGGGMWWTGRVSDTFSRSREMIMIFLFSSSLTVSLSLSQAILRSAPLLSFPASHSYLCKDRWGAEEMKVFLQHSQSPGPNLKIYSITSKPLSLWSSFHHVRVCVAVCESPPRPRGFAVCPWRCLGGLV